MAHEGPTSTGWLTLPPRHSTWGCVDDEGGVALCLEPGRPFFEFPADAVSEDPPEERWTCRCGADLPASVTIVDHMDYCTAGGGDDEGSAPD
jgi:hypothetical protein